MVVLIVQYRHRPVGVRVLLQLHTYVALLLPDHLQNAADLVGLLVEQDDRLSDLVEHEKILITDLTIDLLHAIVLVLLVVCVVVLVSSKNTGTTLKGNPTLLFHHLACVLMPASTVAVLWAAHAIQVIPIVLTYDFRLNLETHLCFL